jgi:phosphomannomutase
LFLIGAPSYVAWANTLNPKEIYVFDMDGTLTPSRQPMEKEFAKWFKKFIDRNDAYLVTGSDLDKIKSQIPNRICKNMKGIFAVMGNEYYERNKLIYKNDFVFDKKLLQMLEDFRKNTKYPYKLYPNYIEFRTGMINFCVVGRDCPPEESNRYKGWDDIAGERVAIQKSLTPLFPNLDFTIGGAISMDIVPKGKGKEQVADVLRNKFPDSLIIFVGDRTEKGGNDYSIAQRLLELGNSKIVPVDNPNDTMKKLSNKQF